MFLHQQKDSGKGMGGGMDEDGMPDTIAKQMVLFWIRDGLVRPSGTECVLTGQQANGKIL